MKKLFEYMLYTLLFSILAGIGFTAGAWAYLGSLRYAARLWG